MRFPARYHPSLVSYIVLALFALQAVVPVGYMPAPASSGSLVQFCPDNVPAEIMAILHPGHSGNEARAEHHTTGHHHSGHGSHHGAHSGHHTAATDNPTHDSANWSADCHYGALSPSLFAFESSLGITSPPIAPLTAGHYSSLYPQPLHHWRQNPGRAPPHTIS